MEHPQPSLSREGEVKLRMLEVGVCGTDRALCAFEFGATPAGSDYFVLGHEALAEVMDTGELVVCGVRQPCEDAECDACRSGRQDFCVTGRYTERGILGAHGFMTEFVVADARSLYRVPRELRDVAVLIEPLTIAEKAFLQFQAIDSRTPWRKERRRAAVLGAGPVGLLGAMLFRAAGFEVWVCSREPRSIVAEAIGAEYVHSLAGVGQIDVVYEAMGAPQAAFDALQYLGANGVFVFTGVPLASEPLSLDLHSLMRRLIMRNQAIVGTVNAGADAFERAVADLAQFHARWPRALASMITGRYPLERFREALRDPGIKNVIKLR